MIEGKKVILRNVEPEDLEDYYELSNDMNEIGPYWSLHLQTKAQIKEKYDKNLWGEHFGQLMITTKDGKRIGLIHFFKGIPYVVGYEIGYFLFRKEDRGKGYMSEACQLFIDFLFLSKRISRLQLCFFEGNKPSIKIGEKCGFVYEGKLREAAFHRGQYLNVLVYSQLRREWEKLYREKKERQRT
jgi:RimJ/RimL family protein N-acetyltransferase